MPLQNRRVKCHFYSRLLPFCKEMLARVKRDKARKCLNNACPCRASLWISQYPARNFALKHNTFQYDKDSIITQACSPQSTDRTAPCLGDCIPEKLCMKLSQKGVRSAQIPEHLSRLARFCEGTLHHLSPDFDLCVALVCIRAAIRRQQKGVQEAAIAHELWVIGRPAQHDCCALLYSTYILSLIHRGSST